MWQSGRSEEIKQVQIAMEEEWNNNPQLVCKISQGPKVMGYMVIDSLVGGSSCGGVRMMSDIDEAEIRELAHAMTLKYGFLGLPQGGAKAGVLINPEAPFTERRQHLAAFARAIAPLLHNRTFIPCTDMGTDNADIRYMFEVAGVRIKRRELHESQSGYYTALTVLAGAKQAALHFGLTLSGCSVAIEGFGKVGNALGKLLSEENARIVAISTSAGAIFNSHGLDVKRLNELVVKEGSVGINHYPEAEQIERTTLLELPVDILCPCARSNSLNANNISQVKARIICPGANIPATADAERALFERGVLFLPDFIINCGGVLGGTMEFASVNKPKIVAFVTRYIGLHIAWILDESEKQGMLPSEIAIPPALRRFNQIQRKTANPTLMHRLFNVSLELYRRGYIPKKLVGFLSLLYFRKLLSEDLRHSNHK